MFKFFTFLSLIAAVYSVCVPYDAQPIPGTMTICTDSGYCRIKNSANRDCVKLTDGPYTFGHSEHQDYQCIIYEDNVCSGRQYIVGRNMTTFPWIPFSFTCPWVCDG